MKHFDKNNFYHFFLRRFYGINGELDEYSMAEINKFGNHMFMFLYSLVLVGFLLELFALADIWDILALLGVFIPFNAQVKLIRRLGLDKLEVEQDQMKAAKKTMFKRTLWQTLIIIGVMLLTIIAMWRMGIPQEDGTSADIFFKIAAPGAMAIMTPIAFLVQLKDNLKKISLIEEGDET
ncbi:hypothetical protein ABID29_001952 [Streptococcus rupicaprae]|uniref:DUF2975 domain-containing protein n=1 Tax=Streptococcus rupicaprae TaxID=759619 RepID=A0ABV2FJR2_9STRE